MARLTSNIVANFAGRIFTVLVGVAVVPLYVSYLGVEGYGLIGIFAALQSIMALFDFGLGIGLNRQLAIEAKREGSASRMRDITRTMEVGYWVGAALLALLWLAVAPWVADSWINPSALSGAELRTAVALMGVAAALQLPFAMYGGGLLGLQRHVVYNLALTAMAALRGVGAVVVLAYVSPTLTAFFVWQGCISIGQSTLGGILLWGSLPRHSRRARFRTGHLRTVGRFAIGVGGAAALGVILSQVDKVLLSRVLSLEEFGYYALAGVLGSSVYFLGTPFYMAFFPRFSELAAAEDLASLTDLYHQSCQMLSVIVLPAAVVGALFSRQIILLWTGDTTLAANASAVASLLVVSYALLSLNGLPYTLQLANGWTRLGVQLSAVSLALAVPTILLATYRYGAVGAAAAWIALNGTNTLAMVYIMHRRLLPDEAVRWFTRDVGLPLLACVPVAVVSRTLMPAALQGPTLLLHIALTSTAAVAAAAAITPSPRRVAANAFRHLLARRSHER